MSKEIRLNVRIERELYEATQVQASKEGRTISDIVRQLLNDFLIARSKGCSLAILSTRSGKCVVCNEGADRKDGT